MNAKRTLLIVDDDATLRTALAQRFTLHEEFKVEQAAHPELTGRVLAARFGLRSAAWVNAILRGAGWREPQSTGAPANQNPDSARQPRRRGSRRG